MNIEGQEMETYQFFLVPIGNAKITEEIDFHPRAPVLKYHQESSNSCCLSSLVSDFHSIGKKRLQLPSKTAFNNHLHLSKISFTNIIEFANAMMKDKFRHKGEQNLRYNKKKWVKKVTFDILNEKSDNVTSVQLMEYLGNENHSISILC